MYGPIWDGVYQYSDFNKSPSGVYSLIGTIPTNGNVRSSIKPGDIKYKDLNGDGEINYGSRTVEDHGDMKVIGNSTPRYQYSFRMSANYLGFDLSFFMQGVGKRDFWANGPVFVPGYRYAEAWYEHQLDYWTPENTDAYYPRPNDQGQSNNAMNFLPQSKYLLDLSYLRMKNITFGYTIPSKVTEKINSLQVKQ